jgi:NADPH2 dehydrogenase
MSDLFSEINIREKKIKNRIVMPPMVCFEHPAVNGVVSEAHVQHYSQRAKGGTGLIIIEATCVNPAGRLAQGQLGLWADTQIPGFKKIADACHQFGAVVLVQLHHAGMAVAAGITKNIIAPSDYFGAVRPGGMEINAREISQEEIRTIQNDFVAASIRAKKAGLDGIELHGAHGYLISQFLSSLVNQRNDAYGGNLLKRTRFVKEIITGARRSCGNDFIIDCRMGCNEPNLADGIAIAQELEKAGVDLLHVSSGMNNIIKGEAKILVSVPPGFDYNWICYGGTQVKQKVKVPVIVCNGIRTPERAAYLIENGLADFSAIGKSMLVDAEWANKAQRKEQPTPCLECQPCAHFRNESRCPQVKTAPASPQL